MKLSFGQNDLLMGESFWPKDSFITHILFELGMPIQNLVQSTYFRDTLQEPAACVPPLNGTSVHQQASVGVGQLAVLKNAAKCGIQFSLAGKKLKRRLSHLLPKSLHISHLFMKLKEFMNYSCTILSGIQLGLIKHALSNMMM